MATQVKSAGGIVLGRGGTVALVQNRANTLWFFPKGHVDPGETDEEAARREIHEEAGLTELEYIGDLGTYERPRILPDGSYELNEVKVIRMFLFSAADDASIKAGMEITEARWVPFREVAECLEDPKDRGWYASVFDRVKEAIQRD